MAISSGYSERVPGVPTSRLFALIPRAVVLHRMDTSDCLDSRLFWASIALSWCGPEVSPDGSVVLKDEDGFLKKNAKGKPIHGKLKDLCEFMGLAPAMMGNISRAAARLVAVGSWKYGDSIPGCKGSKAKIVYPVQEPPSRESRLQVVSTDNLKVWHIGTQVVSIDNFKHLDEVACTELQAELDDASTQWLSNLKAVRTQADALVVQILSARGIIIEKSKKSLLAKSPPPTSQPDLEEEPVAPEPEEEPAGWPPVEVPEEIPETQNPADEVRVEVQAYLGSIPRPGLTPQIVEEVSKHITTPEALEAFKVETMPAKVERGQSWKYFVAIAQRVGADAPRYAAAKANGGNGHSPPVKSRSELRAEAFARRMEEEQKARGR